MPGFVLWFTGLSGSGKSTLTTLVATELRRRGIHVETLDGDEIRRNLSKGLGFSKDDRDANVRRLGFVARLIARSGGCAITAAISPYREVRDEVRQGIERFCEVYCECPVSVLTRRDPKGLYEKALRGEIKNFTGVDDPYEEPVRAEVHLHTDGEDPAASAARIVAKLEELGFVGASAAPTNNPGVLPYGGELQVCFVEPVAASPQEKPCDSSISLSDDAERTVVALGLGLLSPLRGFMGSRDSFKVSREQHLERGLPWPTPLALLAKHPPSPGLQAALCTQADGTLATMDVVEVWSESGVAGMRVAGDIRVARLPVWARACKGAAEVRAAQWGRGPYVALPLFDAPTLGDEFIARAALAHGQRLLLLPVVRLSGHAGLVRACEALVRHYFEPARVEVAAVPAPPGGEEYWAEFLAIFAQNVGASRLLLPERLMTLGAALASGSRAHAALTVEVVGYAEPYFDEHVGTVVTRYAGSAVEPSPSGMAKAMSRRPEVVAAESASE